MIKVKIIKNDDLKIIGFELKGHAKYDDYGYDIVCASASFLAIGVINSLEKLQGVKFKKQIGKEGYIMCEIEESFADVSELLFRHFEFNIRQLSEEYPKNIKIC